MGVAPAGARRGGDPANAPEAARAAGMPGVLVPYGYPGGQDPRLLPCDHRVRSLAELPGLIANLSADLSARQ